MRVNSCAEPSSRKPHGASARESRCGVTAKGAGLHAPSCSTSRFVPPQHVRRASREKRRPSRACRRAAPRLARRARLKAVGGRSAWVEVEALSSENRRGDGLVRRPCWHRRARRRGALVALRAPVPRRRRLRRDAAGRLLRLRRHGPRSSWRRTTRVMTRAAAARRAARARARRSRRPCPSRRARTSARARRCGTARAPKTGSSASTAPRRALAA